MRESLFLDRGEFPRGREGERRPPPSGTAPTGGAVKGSAVPSGRVEASRGGQEEGAVELAGDLDSRPPPAAAERGVPTDEGGEQVEGEPGGTARAAAAAGA